jgi:hypothetical protein
MMADRVSLSGPLSNCVRAPHWRDALDSRPLIGHPACGLEVSDFNTAKASFVFGVWASVPISASSVGDTKSDTQDRYPSSMHRQTEEEAHETS